jgi:hypothetical protein
MGSSLDQFSESWGVDDQSWLATKLGMDFCRPITLDISLFNALHYPNGFIPSGTALGKLTASGLYGPYSPALSNGLDVAAGLLFTAVQVKRSGQDFTVTKVSAPLYWMGVVRTTKLPTFTGAAATLGVLDANGLADLDKHIRFEAN